MPGAFPAHLRDAIPFQNYETNFFKGLLKSAWTSVTTKCDEIVRKYIMWSITSVWLNVDILSLRSRLSKGKPAELVKEIEEKETAGGSFCVMQF